MTKLSPTGKHVSLLCLAAALSVLLIFAILAAAGAPGQAATPKYGGTLRVVGGVWGSYVNNMNPLTPQHLPPTLSAIYEGLFYTNMLTGEEVPLLAVSHEWQDHNLKLVIHTRSGVQWSDGQPFSAKDVAFTFNYLKKYPALDTLGIWSGSVESVTATSGDTVVFTFSKPNTPLLYYIGAVPIVPEHIWSKISDPVTFANPDPVGTGPFVLDSFSTQVVTVKKNPHYWMKGKPYIDKIAFPVFSTNDTALMAMIKNDIDYGYIFIPDPEKSYVARNPKTNKYWWPVNNTNILYLNTAKPPFDNAKFRRAIAMAIDRKALVQVAYYNTVDVADPTGIIPMQLKRWLDPSLKKLAFSYDPAGAAKLLASLGFKKGQDGKLLGQDGKPLSFKLLTGAGWTDFNTMANIISQNLKKIGIETIITPAPWNTYISTLMSGTYDMAICWGTGSGPTPYYLYYQEFSPQFSAEKIGENAQSDYARYTNPEITKALETYRESSDFATQKKAINTIARIVLEEVPFIPLTGRTNFADFNESRFVGWPSASNPYNAGDPQDTPGAELMYLNVHLK
ncbi:MAG: ABC transporter substrate-binding protein [Firmicutes bacterium]|nr:ABC transporter substrate-binding protein [Bacillota bacterium]